MLFPQSSLSVIGDSRDSEDDNKELNKNQLTYSSMSEPMIELVDNTYMNTSELKGSNVGKIVDSRIIKEVSTFPRVNEHRTSRSVQLVKPQMNHTDVFQNSQSTMHSASSSVQSVTASMTASIQTSVQTSQQSQSASVSQQSQSASVSQQSQSASVSQQSQHSSQSKNSSTQESMSSGSSSGAKSNYSSSSSQSGFETSHPRNDLLGIEEKDTKQQMERIDENDKELKQEKNQKNNKPYLDNMDTNNKTSVLNIDFSLINTEQGLNSEDELIEGIDLNYDMLKEDKKDSTVRKKKHVDGKKKHKQSKKRLEPLASKLKKEKSKKLILPVESSPDSVVQTPIKIDQLYSQNNKLPNSDNQYNDPFIQFQQLDFLQDMNNNQESLGNGVFVENILNPIEYNKHHETNKSDQADLKTPKIDNKRHSTMNDDKIVSVIDIMGTKSQHSHSTSPRTSKQSSMSPQYSIKTLSKTPQQSSNQKDNESLLFMFTPSTSSSSSSSQSSYYVSPLSSNYTQTLHPNQLSSTKHYNNDKEKADVDLQATEQDENNDKISQTLPKSKLLKSPHNSKQGHKKVNLRIDIGEVFSSTSVQQTDYTQNATPPGKKFNSANIPYRQIKKQITSSPLIYEVKSPVIVKSPEEFSPEENDLSPRIMKTRSKSQGLIKYLISAKNKPHLSANQEQMQQKISDNGDEQNAILSDTNENIQFTQNAEENLFASDKVSSRSKYSDLSLQSITSPKSETQAAKISPKDLTSPNSHYSLHSHHSRQSAISHQSTHTSQTPQTPRSGMSQQQSMSIHSTGMSDTDSVVDSLDDDGFTPPNAVQDQIINSVQSSINRDLGQDEAEIENFLLQNTTSHQIQPTQNQLDDQNRNTDTVNYSEALNNHNNSQFN
ncbi:MAG: hypothetical protein EZS28_011109 [Streblomastix strix]|uniref:Uncharacterized protein n=1 Tax=Streblomastix strix TaxID=222440 RepID=A0A5J4WF46_9EUKA|nr:MAG: hypothetical protein EZS28_011109 [Streblomastix strix]